MRRDIEPFALAGSFFQVERLCDKTRGQVSLREVAVGHAQGGMRHGEVGIELDGAFEMGNGLRIFESLMLRLAKAESLQGFERRSGGLFERRGELLHRADGLAELAPQAGSGLVERLEDLLLALGFFLFAGQHVPGLGIQSGEGDDIVRAQARDRAGEHGLGALAHADLARDVVGKACVGRAAHEAQSIVDAGFAQQVQVGRLLELDRQRLLQGSIENGIAGCVDEVGEHHRVFFGQRAGSPGTEE